MTIGAFLPVFNEENRICSVIESLLWCDEIILVDKNSTDKTVEIALTYGDKIKVHYLQNKDAYSSSEWDVFLDNCSSKWVTFFTASDVIHPKLVEDILKIIQEYDDEYDIINIPFRRYVLGLESKRSPWYSELSPKIVKKNAMVLNSDGVHDAVSFKGKEYNMKNHDSYCMFHLTHESVDKMMSNHTRYWKGEANELNINLKQSSFIVFREFIKVTLRRKTFLMGMDGIMLSFAYLTYFMMSFVYKWEKKRSQSSVKYQEIRRNISNEWNNSSSKI